MAEAENIGAENMAEITAVVFESAGTLYAVNISSITEISPRSDITFIPKLPDYIIGVVNLMGDVVPVIDLSRRLDCGRGLGSGGCEYDERSCIIFIENDGINVGLRVQKVLTAVSYRESEMIRLPDESSVLTGYIKGQTADRISLLNIERVL